MAGLGDAGDHLLADGFRSDNCVPQLLVEGWQLSAQMDDRQIHVMRTHFAAELFGCRDKTAAQAGFLARGINREQAKVAAIAVQFYVDATRESAVLFSHKEPPRAEAFADAFRVEAIAADEEALHGEGLVYEPHQRVEVAFFGEPEVHRDRV